MTKIQMKHRVSYFFVVFFINFVLIIPRILKDTNTYVILNINK